MERRGEGPGRLRAGSALGRAATAGRAVRGRDPARGRGSAPGHPRGLGALRALLGKAEREEKPGGVHPCQQRLGPTARPRAVPPPPRSPGPARLRAARLMILHRSGKSRGEVGGGGGKGGGVRGATALLNYVALITKKSLSFLLFAWCKARRRAESSACPGGPLLRARLGLGRGGCGVRGGPCHRPPPSARPGAAARDGGRAGQLQAGIYRWAVDGPIDALSPLLHSMKPFQTRLLQPLLVLPPPPPCAPHLTPPLPP